MTRSEESLTTVVALSCDMALVCLCLFSSGVEAVEWTTETVDLNFSTGSFSSVVAASPSFVRVSYSAETSLKYAELDGTGWNVETVDPRNVGAGTSLAVDRDGLPHISYQLGDNYAGGSRDLMYASWDGISWQHETVDSQGAVGYDSALALDSGSYPHISYDGNPGLKYARWSGNTWVILTLDPTGTAGSSSSIAIDGGDHVHIAYTGGVLPGLTYMTWDGQGWDSVQVDPLGLMDTSLALDSAGNPHISYSTAHGVRYARRNGSSWMTQDIDPDVGMCGWGVRSWTSIVVDDGGIVHIGYACLHNTFGPDGDVRHAVQSGAGWDIEIIGTQYGPGSPHSLDMDDRGYLHITFQGPDFTLRHAKAKVYSPSAGGEGWPWLVVVVVVTVSLTIAIIVMAARWRNRRS